MKLSRSAWNNVIIFSVLTMILVINLSNEDHEASQDEAKAAQVTPIAPEEVILTLSIKDVVLIERQGKTWRAEPSNLSEQALEQMMYSWQQSEGAILQEAPVLAGAAPFNVVFELAGYDKPITLSLYTSSDLLLIYHHQNNIWLALPAILTNQLLPESLFTN